MAKGGGGGGNSRQRDMDKHDKDGPSKNQLRSLSYDKTQPKFLRNALAALSGPSTTRPIAPLMDNSGRPAIPERPAGGGGEGEESESEEDEWGFGGGEEAPSVVVLKEGKHLDRNEVDKMRAQAKADSALDPLASSSAPTKIMKAGPSLNFSTGTKRKLAEGEKDTNESWEEVIKRSKVEGEAKKAAKELKEISDKKEKEKGEKAKKKEKKIEKKKVGLLSFDDA